MPRKYERQLNTRLNRWYSINLSPLFSFVIYCEILIVLYCNKMLIMFQKSIFIIFR